MEKRGWDKIEIKRTEELPENDWLFGYFHSSHDNWDGVTWIRNLHELRLRDLFLFALGDLKGKKILDIGCGSGAYLFIIAKMGGEISGQDISSKCVKNAKMFLQENGFNGDIKTGDAVKLLFSDNCFDAVISADFFEHISYEQKNKVVSEVYRVLKPGGVFAIKTPNLDYLKTSFFFKRIFAILTFKNPFKINIPHTHENPDNVHCGLTTYAELEKILLNNMFHSPQITYIPLIRRKVPIFLSKLLYGKKKFTEQIIISSRKPLFYGYSALRQVNSVPSRYNAS